MGGSIILRPDGTDPVRVIHLSELRGAWEIKDDTTTAKKPETPVVTFNDEFRILDIDEVDDILEDSYQGDENRKFAEPDFYYEVSFQTDSIIISCDTSFEDVEDLKVESMNGNMHILFLEKGNRKEIILNVTQRPIPPCKIEAHEGAIEFIIPIGS